jgi:hypothetical protein
MEERPEPTGVTILSPGLTSFAGDPLLDALREHLALAVGGLVFFLSVISILFAADLDAQTGLVLLASSGAVTVVTGILLANAPTVAVFVAASMWLWSLDLITKKRPADLSLLVALATTFLVLLITPVVTIAGFLALFAWFVWRRWRAVRKAKAELDAGRPLRVDADTPADRLISLILTFGLLMLVAGPLWVPSERLQLVTGPSFTGYVVAESANWTTILRNSPRVVVQVHPDSLVSRQVCSPAGVHWLTLLQIVSPPPPLTVCS